MPAAFIIVRAVRPLVSALTAAEAPAFTDLTAFRHDFFRAISGPMSLLIAVEANVIAGGAAAGAPRGSSTAPSALVRPGVLDHESITFIGQAAPVHIIDGFLRLTRAVIHNEREAAMILDINRFNAAIFLERSPKVALARPTPEPRNVNLRIWRIVERWPPSAPRWRPTVPFMAPAPVATSAPVATPAPVPTPAPVATVAPTAASALTPASSRHFKNFCFLES